MKKNFIWVLLILLSQEGSFNSKKAAFYNISTYSKLRFSHKVSYVVCDPGFLVLGAFDKGLFMPLG